MWDFSTDDAYAEKLRWTDTFVSENVEPLDLVLGNPFDRSDPRVVSILRKLQQQVKDAGLWAAHLPPELGGHGYGQVELALLNEILGRSRFAPVVFGCQAPDSGNAEILARFGTEEQKRSYLQPLLDGEISSCYSMTEPQGGADPRLFKTRAIQDGDSWVITGEKWFSSHAAYASFFLVMAVTDPSVSVYKGTSMFIVPAGTAGVEIIRNVGLGADPEGSGSHAYVRYDDVRVPLDHLLGDPGGAFAIAQTRLGGGRIHHCMRSVGLVRRALDMMCERALSRTTRDGVLADLGVVKEQIADCWLQLEQFRLLVLRTAWLIDQERDYKAVRGDIAGVKALMPSVVHDVVRRALHLHGALGVSNELPLTQMLLAAESLGIADGPTEVHKVTLANRILSKYQPGDPLFSSYHLPTRRLAALEKLGEMGWSPAS